MNDERFLREWLEDEAPDSSGARESADRIVARLPETKQRSRWWPLVPSRRVKGTPSGDGGTPTSGRTSSMFSPAKAVIAAALLFAVAGVAFVAQPLDRSSAPAAIEAAPAGGIGAGHTAVGTWLIEDGGTVAFHADGTWSGIKPPRDIAFGVWEPVSDTEIRGLNHFVVPLDDGGSAIGTQRFTITYSEDGTTGTWSATLDMPTPDGLSKLGPIQFSSSRVTVDSETPTAPLPG